MTAAAAVASRNTAGELVELALQPALLLRFDEQCDQLGGGHEPHPVVVLATGHSQGDGQMGLAGSHPADEDDVGGLGDEAAAEDRHSWGNADWGRTYCGRASGGSELISQR